MGLENLQSIFTEGLQIPKSTSVTEFNTNLSSYLPTNLISLTIPDLNSYLPISLAELSVSNQLTFPILDTLQFFNFAGEGSPPTKLYNTYTYDPRTPKTGTITSQNPYSGTTFDNGLGGLFNGTTPYSNAFVTINTPKGYKTSPHGNDIIKMGN